MSNNFYQSNQENSQQENSDKPDFNQQNSEQEFFNQNNQQFTNLKFAGFWIRFFATIVDAIITIPIIWAVFHIIGFDMSNMPNLDQMFPINTSDMPMEKTFMQKMADFSSWLVSITYSVYFLSSRKQATPGKRILGIYVGTKDGNRLSVNRSFARFFATMLSCLTLGVGFLIVAFTKEKTALHDLICDTRVFYGRKN